MINLTITSRGRKQSMAILEIASGTNLGNDCSGFWILLSELILQTKSLQSGYTLEAFSVNGKRSTDGE